MIEQYNINIKLGAFEMKKIVLTSVVLLSLLTSVGCSKHKDEVRVAEPVTTEQTKQDNKKPYKEAGLLTFKNEKQLELGELDSKSRATYAHIQLKDSDEPKDKREAKLKFDPVGWHNYKFYFGDGTKEAWLMNRGHLVGYQFSGLNDEGRNLVPMTAWLNTGAFTGTDDRNQSSMLYYENGLDSWLANHPNYYLDYKVTAVYKDDELIPRQVVLQYVGIDSDGNLLEIKLGSSKEKLDKYSVTHVTLENVSANAEINYADGTAKNTVKSAEERAAEQKAAEEKAKKEAEEKEAQEKAKTEAEKKATEEMTQQETEAPAPAEEESQSSNTGGYFKDRKGRWHRPNGKFASKKEIREAGLQW